MPTLTDKIRETLEASLTPKELRIAIAQMKPPKAPGLDSFSLAYYHTFSDRLIPNFMTAYNSLMVEGSMPADSLRTYISLILKEGKDPVPKRDGER